MLQFVHNNVWKIFLVNKQMAVKISTEDENEYRIIDNSPITNKYIPYQKGQSICAVFLGGLLKSF